MMHWRAAYIALGSNLQAPRQQVLRAFERMGKMAESRLIAASPLYRTQPVGITSQPDFVNAAAGLITRLSARELLDEMQAIETAMGRVRREKWGPRIIDLDLVWLRGAQIDEEGLTVPHPQLAQRNFVLYPLHDIAPGLEIPGLGSIASLKLAAGGAGIERLEP